MVSAASGDEFIGESFGRRRFGLCVDDARLAE
jgi:hypothetical protein